MGQYFKESRWLKCKENVQSFDCNIRECSSILCLGTANLGICAISRLHRIYTLLSANWQQQWLGMSVMSQFSNVMPFWDDEQWGWQCNYLWQVLLNLCPFFIWWLTCEEGFVTNCPSWVALVPMQVGSWSWAVCEVYITLKQFCYLKLCISCALKSSQTRSNYTPGMKKIVPCKYLLHPWCKENCAA